MAVTGADHPGLREPAGRARHRLRDSVLDAARSARLRVGAREGLVVVVPAGLGREKVKQLVLEQGRLDRGAPGRVRHGPPPDPPAGLRASPGVRPAGAGGVLAGRVSGRCAAQPWARRTDQPGRIVVYGAVRDVEACHAALRRWLARHATRDAVAVAGGSAEQSGLRYADISIKNQRTRWGSCATVRAHQPELQAALPAARTGALRDGSRALPPTGAQSLASVLGACAAFRASRRLPSRANARCVEARTRLGATRGGVLALSSSDRSS